MKPSITRDTLKLTAVSFILQTIGLVLNTFISNRLGTVSVGIMSLIFSWCLQTAIYSHRQAA